MSVTRHHADWLSLVEVSGPFVSLPVLQKVFPQGLEGRDPAQAKALRAAYEEWQDNPSAPGMQRAWVMHILTSVLAYPESQIAEGQTLPAGLEANMPEMGETLRPDFGLIAPAGTEAAGQAQLLIAIYPGEQSLDKPVIGKHWKATPGTRMMEMLHSSNVPLGLVTNGEQWMLVYAPRGEITGYASWYGALWLDEPITLRAFHSLIGVRRFFGVAADSTLLALLKESANDQQEVTDQLGYQVREAVEVLVQSFDGLDKESSRTLLKDVKPASLYDSALTVMMRLVFLFSAEERGLLHLGQPLYDDNYAVSTLQEQLQEVADRYGEEVLERRTDAWARLLATFRAVHGGIKHQDLLMQAYGGSLFDPDRYAFLEGRAQGSKWRITPAEPLSVNNRVVLHLLNSLQRLRTKVGAGTTAETRRVSFRALGVEQIGHVYEGLLDHTAFRADEVVVGIRGTRSKEPEIALATLESLKGQGEDKLIEFLKEETGRSISALRRELNEGSLLDEHKLLNVCEQNGELLNRLRPFAGLIRDDSFERPWVVLPGSIFVTSGTTRRSTGTHYTPPTLTEPIVQHTLEPLVYVGPAEGHPREQWKLKSPKEILDLKVCDMAMGSGAFLVQACRYLAERLVEAWENEEKRHPGQVLITPDGNFSEGSPSERLVPAEAAERIAIARRVVADRCLYGVDINPMAVEMAKLSMWLITVDAKRPFTFLDHAFKCGDSLLGITSLEQLENFSLRPAAGKLQGFNAPGFAQYIDEAKKKREALERMASDTPEQIATKTELYSEAEEVVARLNAAADVLVAVEFSGLKGKAYESKREAAAYQVTEYWSNGLTESLTFAHEILADRRCFHWALAFPEIIEGGGFSAFVGNPPFVGGKRIRGALGEDYQSYVTRIIGNNVPGSADLCGYFFLRAAYGLRNQGQLGLIATNSIAQGGTREVSLDQILSKNYVCTRAISSQPWPGTASLEVSHVWIRRGEWNGHYVLDCKPVTGITSFLTEAGKTKGKPFVLSANSDKSYVGSVLSGIGFVLTPDEAQLLALRNNNSDCLYPYLNGEDITTRFDQSASRWAINFWDWPLSRAAVGQWDKSDNSQKSNWLANGVVPTDYPGKVASDYPELLKIVKERVKPHRDGVNRKAYRDRWWLYAEPCMALYKAISGAKRVLVIPETTKFCTFAWSTTEIVFSHMTKVMVLESDEAFCILCSSIHEEWARFYSSTLETRLKYAPTDAFETFPFPKDIPSKLADLTAIGCRYEDCRRQIMTTRQQGITQTYNRFHDKDDADPGITELRHLHVEMDNAVAAAYEWQDLDLGHDFHETKQGIRYTISGAARREILDRLLSLNHQRHAEEESERAALPATKAVKRARKPIDSNGQATLDI